MHPETLAALEQLAAALVAHPEDAGELAVYSDLPTHLSDALEDFAGGSE